MSSFRDAVQEWNQRLKDDGWRSTFAPALACPECQTVGVMLETIRGTTKGRCEHCGHRWEL